jgi:ABC-type uncharacterized transport system substrate-binding protein
MKRRDFLVAAGLAAASLRSASGQQLGPPVIGFLSSRSPGDSAEVLSAFRAGLKEGGFIEGQNVFIAFRWAEGRYERLPALASELIGLHVAALCAAGGPPSALAAQKATSTIPIIFPGAGDPVRLGLVASFNRPGGNITGINNLSMELPAKSVEILKEMLPNADVIGYLINPSNPGAEAYSRGVLDAANRLGIRVLVVRANSVDDLDEASRSLSEQGINALIVTGEPFFDSQREKIVALSSRYKIAGCYPWRDYVSAGGLMNYGTSLPDAYRLAGTYVARVLKGEKPSDLPVIQPTKFALVINLKTARTLGIAVPPSLLARADEVIE